MADGDVPYHLLDPTGSSSAPSAPPTGPKVTIPQVYFLDEDGRLVPQGLPLEATGLELVLDDLLSALSAGPTELQRAQGLSSALGSEIALQNIEVADMTARIAVAPSTSPAPDRLPLAVAQIVLSATSVEGVDDVLLFQDNEPLEAPLPGGELTSRPVAAADYASLLASSVPDTHKPELGPTVSRASPSQ